MCELLFFFFFFEVSLIRESKLQRRWYVISIPTGETVAVLTSDRNSLPSAETFT